MRIQGIVFDKDGTLFDFNATWGAWAKTMLQAETVDPATFDRLATALGFDADAARFLPGSIVIAETTDVVADRILTVLPDLNKGDLIDRMRRRAAEVAQVTVGDLPRIFADLDAFSLGIATNDNEATARAHVAQAGIADAFDLVLGYDSGFGGKPAPGQLLRFCEVTGHNPGKCVMVGDSLHDLHAGQAAGMIPIGVLTGPAPRETLAPYAADVLTSIADLPSWIAANA
ncbi:phosphoglycolate phosphatase [Cognatiyoonia koreensis]|uniref:phosphoglycolate phosphatase n=1 Tax=Cognatiyoonia koreensis TaxID=364200 RepID=A0A1I0QFA8_9RHOB|nr:HAD family hydrolase [Cognatiyoonia koreensis]SEW25286.1 phosphoglycolate phosphatase [Cognatiyoonia koreensis]